MKKKIKNLIIGIILYFKNFNIENSILIFSEARGGSTWLMEILKTIPNSCINWEPLHPEKGVIPKKLKWGWVPYLLPSNNNKENNRLIKNMLTLKTHTPWTKKYLKGDKIFSILTSKYVITKFVRGNLLVPYIVTNFKFKSKPFVLVRHPIDVCFSHLNTFKDAKEKYAKFKIPNCINNQRFMDHADFINELQTTFEIKIAEWCLNNCMLFENKDALKKTTIIFYSDLLLHPEQEAFRIFDSLKGTINTTPKELIHNIDFRKPSTTNFNNNLIADPAEQLHKNLNKLSLKEKQQIQKIFDHFNLKLFDAFSPYAKKETLE